MTRPLSWSMRFALAVSAVFAFGAILAGSVAWMLQSQELSRRLEADVAAMAQSFAATARQGDRRDLVEQVNAQATATRNGAILVAFVDAATGDTVGNMRLDAPFDGPRHLVVGRDVTLLDAPTDQAPEGYYAYGVRTGLGWVVVARDDAWIVEGREILLASTGWGLGLALALAIAFAVFIARRNEARIARMEHVLDAVGAGRTELRIRETGDDDLARLAVRVDATLDRLEAGIAAVRQVSTDVAHDLRAPLSRLRMRLEPQALDRDNPEPLRQEIGAALADLDAISATFDAILRLSRLQSGKVDLRRDEIDLVALAVEVEDILGPSAEETGHSIRLALPGVPVMATGDAELLTQALVNLVDNALRHCPAPCEVVVTVAQKQGASILSVCDNGPGIPEQDRARVTDRFVRLDASRTTQGTGLGLSLVAAIAKLHDARLSLDDNHPGLCARLEFAGVQTAAKS